MKISDRSDCKDIVLGDYWPGMVALPESSVDSLLLMFCRHGSAGIALNDEPYRINANGVLIGFPGEMVLVDSCSHDFSGSYLYIPMELLDRILLLSLQGWQTGELIREKRLFCLGDDNVGLMQSYLCLMEARSQHSVSNGNRDGIYDLLSSFVNDFLSIVGKACLEQDSRGLSSANILFSRFMKMLRSDSPQKHGIEYYSDRLCVTPKYLSAVCKRVTGETALTLINRCLVAEIRHQLRNPAKPIKEIAYELSFSNQSFFGKFVKAHLGMTASQFRRSMCL